MASCRSSSKIHEFPMTRTNFGLDKRLRRRKIQFCQAWSNKYILSSFIWYYPMGRVMCGLFINPLTLEDIRGDVCLYHLRANSWKSFELQLDKLDMFYLRDP